MIKTVSQLKAAAAVIRDETAIGGNTNLRVYNMLVDMIDSLCLILDILPISTAGAELAFDFALKQARKFLGSSSFGSAKEIIFSNDENALEFDFAFNISNVAAVLTFPSNVVMTDVRWNPGAKTWTPDATGWFKGHAELNGTDFMLDISPYTYS